MRGQALITRWVTEADFGEVELQRIVPTAPWPISLMVTQTIKLRDREEQRTVVIPLTAAQAREIASDLVDAANEPFDTRRKDFENEREKDSLHD